MSALRRKTWRTACLYAAACGLLMAGSAQAVTIGISTTTPMPVTTGTSIFLEISITDGLIFEDAPSLTSFEFDLSFDEVVLDFVDLVFAPGDYHPCNLAESVLDLSCDLLVDFSSSSGVVEFGGAALVSPAEINASQPATGLLATLEFFADAPGITTPTFTQHALGGTTSGTALGTLSFTESGTTITVLLPEPSITLLLGLLVVGLFCARPRHLARS